MIAGGQHRRDARPLADPRAGEALAARRAAMGSAAGQHRRAQDPRQIALLRALPRLRGRPSRGSKSSS